MENRNLGIVGFGVLGKALKHVFDIKFQVYIYDKYNAEYQDIGPVAKNCRIIFLAVPTPMKEESGEIDLAYVEDALEVLSKAIDTDKKPIVVLRSTIIPGTTERLQEKYPNLNLVFNPEFLTEKNFLNDMRNTSRVVLGSSNENFSRILQEVYLEIFPDAEYILTNLRTAEMIKYASNVTLASQISIANEIYQICQKTKVDYEIVKKTLLLDPRIGKNINVPGSDGDLGFGGKCFPKDLNALIFFSKLQGYEPKLLEEVWKTNLRLRKNKDWLNITGATSGKKFKSIN